MDVVVLDHHRGRERAAARCAHVNPNQPGDTSGLGHLCAAGVTFLFLVALNRHLRDSGFYEARGMAEPDLRDYLDLVGLATVCDVVPLIGVNRAFVRHGLGQIGKLARPGLAALAAVAKAKRPFTPYHLGFVFGPRINAGGRVGRSQPGRRSADRARRRTARANSPPSSTCTISERQAIEKLILEEAMAHGRDAGQRALPAGGGRGLASRRGRHRRRAAEGALRQAGFCRGLRRRHGARLGAFAFPASISARMVRAAREAGLIESGGGHAMAAGFSLTAAQLEAFANFVR